MVDVTTCIADLVFRLNFKDSSDLAAAGNWVTTTELYQWADEAAQKIAYASSVYVTYDTSITVTSGTAVYNLPASHVFTLAAWLGTNALRITPVNDLWALDATWPTSSGAATRCSLDAGKVGTITIYPIPSAGGTLAQVCQAAPAPIDVTTHTVSLPSVLQDYLSYAMLAGARAKESDAMMPEMADHFDERCRMYEAVIQHLYGQGQ